jgi:protease-4
MSMDADLLADRRRMRRKLSLWRGLTFLVLAGAAIGIGLSMRRSGALPGFESHVARIEITGMITGDKRTLEMIKRVEDSKAAAVLVRIDSPGGTVTGSEAVYDAIRRLAAKKPTVATIESTGASGAYIAALATDRIFARQTSIVGSIGVIFQYPEVVKLLDMVGVKMEILRSTPLKANPSGLEPTTPEAREAMRILLADHFNWFKTLVRTRRSYSETETSAVADGRVHAGARALELKLIDAVGSEPEARAWLAANRKIDAKWPVRDYRRRSETDAFGLIGDAADLTARLGLASLSSRLAAWGGRFEALSLDGSLALWQPRGEN